MAATSLFTNAFDCLVSEYSWDSGQEVHLLNGHVFYLLKNRNFKFVPVTNIIFSYFAERSENYELPHPTVQTISVTIRRLHEKVKAF